MQQPTPTTNTATPISSSRTLEAAESMVVVVVVVLLSWASGGREDCVGKEVGLKDGSTVGMGVGATLGGIVG